MDLKFLAVGFRGNRASLSFNARDSDSKTSFVFPSVFWTVARSYQTSGVFGDSLVRRIVISSCRDGSWSTR